MPAHLRGLAGKLNYANMFIDNAAKTRNNYAFCFGNLRFCAEFDLVSIFVLPICSTYHN